MKMKSIKAIIFLPILLCCAHTDISNQQKKIINDKTDLLSPSLINQLEGLDTLICNQYIDLKSDVVCFVIKDYDLLSNKRQQQILNCIKSKEKSLILEYFNPSQIPHCRYKIWFKLYNRKNKDNSIDTLLRIGTTNLLTELDGTYWYSGDDYKISKIDGKLLIIKKLLEPRITPL